MDWQINVHPNEQIHMGLQLQIVVVLKTQCAYTAGFVIYSEYVSPHIPTQIPEEDEVVICHHQADARSGDLQASARVWSYMTLNAHTVTRCHEETQSGSVHSTTGSAVSCLLCQTCITN